MARSYWRADPNWQSKMEFDWQNAKPKVAITLTKNAQMQQEKVCKLFNEIWTQEKLKQANDEAEKKRMKDEDEMLAKEFLQEKQARQKSTQTRQDLLDHAARWELTDPKGWAEEEKRMEASLSEHRRACSSETERFLAAEYEYRMYLRTREAEEKLQRDQAFAAALQEGQRALAKVEQMVQEQSSSSSSSSAVIQNAKKKQPPKTIPCAKKQVAKVEPSKKRIKVEHHAPKVSDGRMDTLEQWQLEQTFAESKSAQEENATEHKKDKQGKDAKNDKKAKEDKKDKKDKKGKKDKKDKKDKKGKKNKKDKKTKKANKDKKGKDSSTTLNEWCPTPQCLSSLQTDQSV